MSADFGKIADYYDLMYVNEEEYRKEAEQATDLILRYGAGNSGKLLDLACGTGAQSRYLAETFSVTGLDLSEEMLEIARRKAPKARFLLGDMTDFDLGEVFGAAVNLYGSIGFCRDGKAMRASLCCAARHLEAGGILILTPWSTRETFREGLVADSRMDGGLSFCRMETVRLCGRDPGRVRVEMHHLLGKGLEVTERFHVQEISLFSEAEYREAIRDAGFELVRRIGEEEFRMGAFVCRKK